MTQILEINRGRNALIRRLLEFVQIVTNVDACNHGALRSEKARHSDDAEIPAAVSGHEQHDITRFAAAAVHVDFAEAPIVEDLRRCGRWRLARARGRRRVGARGRRRRRSHGGLASEWTAV